MFSAFEIIRETDVISMWLIITVGECLVHGYFIGVGSDLENTR